MNKTTAIVTKLTEPLLKQGQTVWMDNYYNSPELASSLKTIYQTDYVRTLKSNRKNVPKKVRYTKLEKKGMTAKHSSPVSVIKWSNKKM
jgi:hypothetical protein